MGLKDEVVDQLHALLCGGGAESPSTSQTPENFLAESGLVSSTASRGMAEPGIFTSLKKDFLRDD